MKDTLQKLSDMRGVSGFEYRINDKIADMMKPFCDEVYITATGSVIGIKKAKNPTAKIMLEAHCDEIGLMVKNIDKDGFITFVTVGGVDRRILPSCEVTIHGKKDIWGVIGAKPPHLQTAGEAKKSVKIENMAIDTGLSYDEVTKYIAIGDSITLSQSSGALLNHSFSGKSIDDRGGIAVLLDVMKNIRNTQLSCDIYFIAAVQEEVGLRGAKTAAYEVDPDMAIAIDVCHGITPDNSESAFETGSGTVISKGPNIHPKIAEKLQALADENKIKYSIDVDGGDTGTDAWTIQVTREGIATGLLSIPLKYMHTSVETVDLDDLTATSELLSAFIKDTKEAEWLCC